MSFVYGRMRICLPKVNTKIADVRIKSPWNLPCGRTREILHSVFCPTGAVVPRQICSARLGAGMR